MMVMFISKDSFWINLPTSAGNKKAIECNSLAHDEKILLAYKISFMHAHVHNHQACSYMHIYFYIFMYCSTCIYKHVTCTYHIVHVHVHVHADGTCTCVYYPHTNFKSSFFFNRSYFSYEFFYCFSSHFEFFFNVLFYSFNVFTSSRNQIL